MIVARKGAAYVDPFDRICHGLGPHSARNYRLERSFPSVSDVSESDAQTRRIRRQYANRRYTVAKWTKR